MNTGVLGVIFGNRDFFPDHLVGTARSEVKRALDKLELGYCMLEESDTKLGGVKPFRMLRNVRIFSRRTGKKSWGYWSCCRILETREVSPKRFDCQVWMYLSWCRLIQTTSINWISPVDVMPGVARYPSATIYINTESSTV